MNPGFGRVTVSSNSRKTMISPETLQRAKQIIDSIESLQSELAGLFGASVSVAAPAKRRGRPPGSGKRSVAAVAAASAPGGKQRRNMSAEGRARIAAAAKARWARFRSEQKKAGK